MMFHPRVVTLIRHADRVLAERQRQRVADHLAACPKCRADLLAIRQIEQAAKGSCSPSALPSGVLETVLQRRASGERVILPVEDPPLKQPSSHRVLVAGGVTAGLLGWLAVSLIAVDQLRAARSELRFTPAMPQRGAVVTVEYDGAGVIGAPDHVVLRARFRTPGDPPYNLELTQAAVAVLERRGAATYRGTIQLPDSVVYAAFAVEDPSGQRVDSNGRRLWELLTYVDGQPERDALLQRHNDMFGRNWEIAYKTVRDAAARFADDPEIAYQLSFMEQQLAATLSVDSLKQLHTERFRQLQVKLTASGTLSGDELAGMFWLAATGATDSTTVAYWRTRLLVEAPRHPLAVQELVVDMVGRYRDNAPGLQRALEAIWARVGSAHEQLLWQGFLAARRSGDGAAMKRWAGRLLVLQPGAGAALVRRMLDVPECRALALAWLREQLQPRDPRTDPTRALFRSVVEHRVHDAARRRTLLADLGLALAAEGHIQAAVDSLTVAAASGWDVAVFRAAGDLMLTHGDTSGALAMLARVAVDPASDAAYPDSLRELAGSTVGLSDWARFTQQARELMRARVLATATRFAVPEGIQLVDFAGHRSDLRSLVAGRIAVVAFWSPYCAPSLNQLTDLQDVAEWLAAVDGTLVSITVEQPTASLGHLMSEQQLSFPVLFDAKGLARRALELWPTPEYLVLDNSGWVRFRSNSVAEVRRQVAVLTGAPSQLVADR